ncbi:MAG: hypothetical protein NTW73_02645, partial [Candidatus Parcubacteria bacterium]|nr:hypothetical protein [Candidatus Parcubacteria bacterium]
MNISNWKLKIFLFLFAFLFLFVLPTYAVTSKTFFVNLYSDPFGRSQIQANLIRSTGRIEFYLDDFWYANRFSGDKEKFLQQINDLSLKANSEIWPLLSQKLNMDFSFGPSKEKKLIILLCPISQDVESYIRKDDGYFKKDYPSSNEAGVIYLSASLISDQTIDRLSYYLAHELTHLITFELKEKPNNVKEDIWLNEARAEYAGTLLGYDQNWQTSNLKRRATDFLNLKTFSLLNWENKPENYATVNFLMQYLVGQYGEKIWVDTLRSKGIGIQSLNDFFNANGNRITFSNVFTNWLIASAVNDCSLGNQYCYSNPLLRNLVVFPANYYLPSQNLSSMSIQDTLKVWGAKWQKIVGGQGSLRLEFTSYTNKPGQILPYIVIKQDGKKSINSVPLSYNVASKVIISDFNGQNAAFVFIPNIFDDSLKETKTSNYSYAWNAVNTSNARSEEEAKRAEQLIIDQLQAEVDRLTKILANLIAQRSLSCPVFNQDLYYGLKNNASVNCLQKFLKEKYPNFYQTDITGNYYFLTQIAVTKYQALKGLPQTGYFG